MTKLLPCADWAEKLAQKPEDLSPADREALQAHLATCPACAQTLNDYQMLIGRLRALPRPAPRPMPQFVLEAFAPPADQESAGALNGANNARAQPEHAGSIILLPPLARRRRVWQRRLSGLVAAVVLLALVSTLALLFLQHGQSTGGGIFQIRPGWQQIALYSGTGNKTITGLHLQLPSMWGSAFTCTGSGEVDVKATGPNYISGGGPSDCQGTDHHPTAPAGMILDITPHEIQTITVKADAHTRWYYIFLEKAPQPSFTLGPGWTEWGGIGGTGNGRMSNAILPPPYQASLWGAVFVCTGSGTGTIQFTEWGEDDPSGSGGIQTPPCDGQPRLITIQYPYPTAMRAFAVNMRGSAIYYANILACTDESQCQSTPAPINVTPTPTGPPNAPPGA